METKTIIVLAAAALVIFGGVINRIINVILQHASEVISKI